MDESTKFIIAMGLPTLSVLVGILLNNRQVDMLRGQMDMLRSHIDMRFDLLERLFDEKLKRH